jgi:hypothetical protein
MLADEVHNAPATVALLDIGERDRGHRGLPKAQAQENSEDRTVPQSFYRCDIGALRSACACRNESQLPSAKSRRRGQGPSILAILRIF